jgi:hypothetical protein
MLLRTIPIREALFLAFFLSATLCFAQENSFQNYFIDLNYRTGKNTPHRQSIENLKYPCDGAEIKLGWQTTGKSYWQQAYRYPSLGVGFNWNTFQTDLIGAPFALYFFTSFPQFRLGPVKLDLEFDLGLSYGINPYHPETNPDNMATGSRTNLFYGMYLEQTIFWNKPIQLFISEGISHYSNGAIEHPNFGLNIPSLKFGVRYHPTRYPFLKSEKPEVKRYTYATFMLSSGIKKLDYPKPIYKEVSIIPTVWTRLNYKRQVGAGFEIAYNEARRMQRNLPNPVLDFPDLITYSVFLSHEKIIEDFTLLTQFGVYLKNQPALTFYYERIGIGYYIAPNFRVMLNLKAHYIKAEYLELALCYDFFRKR